MPTTINDPTDIYGGVHHEATLCADCIDQTRREKKLLFDVIVSVTDSVEREDLIRNMPTNPDDRCTRCGLRRRVA